MRDLQDASMSGPTAVVTGASGGIGAAVVADLLAEGYAVHGLDLAPASVTHEAYRHHAVGVTDVDGLSAVASELPEVDGLVNVAGALRPDRLADLDPTDLREMLEVNVLGVLLCSQAFLPALRRSAPSGGIVTVASNAARVPRTGIGGYGATKAAASMLTRSLGLEEARHGVRCNVVLPGSTRTPMLTSLWDGEGSEQSTLGGDLEAHRLGIPLQRIAEPADIAGAVRFLLSPAARQITVHELVVDGGATP